MKDIIISILQETISGLIVEKIKLTFENTFGKYKNENIENNKEIYLAMISAINSMNNVNEKLDELIKQINSNKLYLSYSNLYNTKFALRLDYVISLMNNVKKNNKVNLEKLARDLGFDSVNVLNQYYLKDEEPSFDFIDSIASKLGINNEWLSTGINTQPFKVKQKISMDFSNLNNFFNRDNSCNDNNYFIGTTGIGDEEIKFIITKKVSNYKYLTTPLALEISNTELGNGGLSRVNNFFGFIKQLSLPHMYRLNNKSFTEILNGKAYPEKIMYGKDVSQELDIFLDRSLEFDNYLPEAMQKVKIKRFDKVYLR